LRLIFSPDNTPYYAFCYSRRTLAMSYSVENQHVFKDQPLTKDYPVLEDSHNWEKYRLGK
jgi:hypothetical protein